MLKLVYICFGFNSIAKDNEYFIDVKVYHYSKAFLVKSDKTFGIKGIILIFFLGLNTHKQITLTV
jgi:hypothetical protein